MKYSINIRVEWGGFGVVETFIVHIMLFIFKIIKTFDSLSFGINVHYAINRQNICCINGIIHKTPSPPVASSPDVNFF